MLKRLHIRNYAIVRDLELVPGQGLNILTGETGAGKSITVDALALTLGERAESGAIRHGTDKCVIEAEFQSQHKAVAEALTALHLDIFPTVILRRELLADGRSRAFINDTPVRLNELRQVGGLLVDIHSQHAVLALRDPKFLLDITDAWAGSALLAANYRAVYQNMLLAKANLKKAEETLASGLAERDFVEFQFNELNDLKLNEGELPQLEQELTLIENAAAVRQSLAQAQSAMEGDEADVLGTLSQGHQLLLQSGKHLPAANDLAQRMRSVLVELKDILGEMGPLVESLDFDPERAEVVRARVDVINRLCLKHRKSTDGELLALRNELEARLQAMEHADDQVVQLRKQVDGLNQQVRELALELSAQRGKVVALASEQLTLGVRGLGMPSGTVQLHIDTLTEPGPDGLDAVRLLFSGGKGIPLNDAGKVASGGELSRLMLTLKGLLATKMELPTVVLDEVDTGVSGETAAKVGDRIAQLAQSLQVICITHLPQVAAKAHHHLHVIKREDAQGTYPEVLTLTGQQRVTELARMLSAGEPTPAALANAETLIGV